MMEITITWTKIIVLALSYFGGRYLYHSYVRWYSGYPEPFDFMESLDTSMYYRGWQMGKVHGSHLMKAKYARCKKKLEDLEEAYSIARQKLNAYEDQLFK